MDENEQRKHNSPAYGTKRSELGADADIRSRLDRWDNLGALKSAVEMGNLLARKDIAETAQSIYDDIMMTTDYLIKGVKDPERPNLVGHIRERAYALTDVIRITAAGQSRRSPQRESLMAISDGERHNIEESIATYKQHARGRRKHSPYRPLPQT